MSFTLELTDEQLALREKTHSFARDVIRPVAAEYDRAQELPWPVLQEAARQGLYGWELYAWAPECFERLVLACARSARPITSRWISLVPSKIVYSLASLYHFSTGKSLT